PPSAGGDQRDRNAGGQNPRAVAAGYPLSKQDRRQHDGRDRVERREHGRDIEPPSLGGEDEEGITGHVARPDERGKGQHRPWNPPRATRREDDPDHEDGLERPHDHERAEYDPRREARREQVESTEPDAGESPEPDAARAVPA